MNQTKKNEWVYDFEKGKRAAEIVKTYIGQQEIPGNKGFVQKGFDKLMRAVGFYTGAAWCGFLPRVAWNQAGLNPGFISPSSTFQVNSSAKGEPMEGNWHTEPVLGAVAVWAIFRGGKRQSRGHFSTVVSIEKTEDTTTFQTVDGNSNSNGSREGKEVVEKNHTLDIRIWSKKEGLRLLGFLYPTSQEGNVKTGLKDGKK